MKVCFSTLIVVIMAASSPSFSQQWTSPDPYLTECKIVFEVNYPELQPASTMASSMPAERTVYLQNDRMRVETKMADGHTDIILVDCKNKIAHALNEVSEKKYAVKLTPDDIQKECTKIPYVEVKSADDFKEIAGYHCQKNEYLIKDKNHDTFTCNIYTNYKIVATNPNWFTPLFREVGYFMFEYSMKQNGIVLKFTAKSVELLKESSNIFEVPSGYKVTSKEEFSKLKPNSAN